MKLSSLILAIGDENVIFQNLINDAATVDKTAKGTKITFYTNAIQAEDFLFRTPDKIGLVVWLPREAAEKAIAEEKGTPL